MSFYLESCPVNKKCCLCDQNASWTWRDNWNDVEYFYYCLRHFDEKSGKERAVEADKKKKSI